MNKLKTVGLILAGVCFLLLDILFFAAAITVAGVLLWSVCALLGFVEVGEVTINWWIAMSFTAMLLEGTKSQLKQSSKLIDEFIDYWGKR